MDATWDTLECSQKAIDLERRKKPQRVDVEMLEQFVEVVMEMEGCRTRSEKKNVR